MSDRRNSMGTNPDDPPNSRLFIIGSKSLTEEDYRKAFEKFGSIEEIWTVRDKHTGDNKGITYIKYERTSEAARALEAMCGKYIGNVNKPLRVLIASSREQGSKREANEEEKTQRLFVVVPKSMVDSELYDHFKEYGDIDYANIMRDRESRESKGFAYVKFKKFSQAAEAFENCDRKFKPVFAEPRKSNMRREENYHPSRNSYDSPPQTSTSFTRLIAIVNPQVNQDQLWRLFDIVPGLDYCHLTLEGEPTPRRAIASIVYKSPQSASYAKEKLHGFEYPPGNRIIVKPDFSCDKNRFDNYGDILYDNNPPDIPPPLIPPAGNRDDFFCSVSLPDQQPLMSMDEPTASRCFIVCVPHPLPNSLLRNIFSRFGYLIDVYLLNNRNCGFAKYALKESAENAMKTLHGAEIDGVYMKVLKAEERHEQTRKRQRIEDKSQYQNCVDNSS